MSYQGRNLPTPLHRTFQVGWQSWHIKKNIFSLSNCFVMFSSFILFPFLQMAFAKSGNLFFGSQRRKGGIRQVRICGQAVYSPYINPNEMKLSVSEVPVTFADKTDAGLGQWKNSVWYKWQETWSLITKGILNI